MPTEVGKEQSTVSNVRHEDYKSPTPKAETTTNRRGQGDFRKVLQLRLYVRYTFRGIDH
jgi:hypothetical protein